MILTCRQLVEKATEAQEGHLSRLDRIGWALHLSWCRHCRRYVAQLEQTRKWLRLLSRDESAPKDVIAAALSHVRKKQ